MGTRVAIRAPCLAVVKAAAILTGIHASANLQSVCVCLFLHTVCFLKGPPLVSDFQALQIDAKWVQAGTHTEEHTDKANKSRYRVWLFLETLEHHLQGLPDP